MYSFPDPMKKKPLTPGAALAAMRPITEKVCQRCGRIFAGITRAKCCSQACNNAAWRDRHPEAKLVYVDGRRVRLPAKR